MKTCLNFFTENIVEELGDVEMSPEETRYVASILASFASTSRFEQGNWAPATDTREVFDRFVLQRNDSGFVAPQLTAQQAETAGAQLMLVVGFFRSQVHPRVNLRFHSRLGQNFFFRASRAFGGKRGELLESVSFNFGFWCLVQRKLNQRLREDPYVLKL